MRIIRPPWLNHGGDKKDAEVYSCHVSPDGKRLATAAGDSHVRIWSTETIFKAADDTYSGPRQLASMSHHLGTIHAVRFSSNGRYLASGADDKYVCVYVHDPTPPSHASTFGTNEPPPIENWRLVRRLPGHDNDVQDIGWSYDSSILVSVGLDSKVVVWSGHTFEKLKTISTHSSHVKGITFDPANKYFATASDDRTIKVFRFTPPAPNSNPSDHLNNFVLEKSISWASHLSPLTTYFRRCSWSPDGNLIAAANSVNGPVSSVAIITRGTWEPGDQSVHLIGHEAPVEVCAFSPRMFSKEAYDPEKPGELPPSITIIACAGQDKTLTVWSTMDSRPVIIAHDLCQKSFSDIAWHPDGKSLFATSLDGTITLVSFEGTELGHALPPSLTDQALARFGAGRKGAGIVEGPSELLLEEMSKEGEMKDVQDRMAGLMGDTAGGLNSPATTTNALQNGASNTAKASEETQANGSKASNPLATTNEAKSEKLKSRITITKDGKKRLAPLLVSSSSTTASNLPQASLRTAASSSQPIAEAGTQSVLDLSKPIDSLPRGGLSAMLLGNKRRLVQTEGDEDNQLEKRINSASENGATPILINTPQGLTLPRAAKASDPPIIPDYIRPAVVNHSLSVSNVRLAVPKVRARIIQRFAGSESSGNRQGSGSGQAESENVKTLLFEAQNPTGPSPTGRQSDREPSRILVSRGEMVWWHDYLPRSVLLLAHGENFWAAACEDGSLYTWTLQGRRLLNAIVLESQPVILDTKDSWLLCLTAAGQCYVFNMQNLGSPHPPVSLAPVLDIATQLMVDSPRPGPAVTSARVTSEGRICVSISNGDTYSYSPMLFSWQRISEPWWAVGSQYWNSTDAAVGNVASGSSDDRQQSRASAGVISFLERQTSIESTNRGRFGFLQRLVKTLLPREGYENLESSISIAHLENRLAAALQLGAKDDFRAYLNMYVKCLGSEVQRGKVEELLADLARGGTEEMINGNASLLKRQNAPSEETVNRDIRDSSDTVCGWPKLELLDMVTLILGKQRELSRLVKPYRKIVEAEGRGRAEQNADTMSGVRLDAEK